MVRCRRNFLVKLIVSSVCLGCIFLWFSRYQKELKVKVDTVNTFLPPLAAAEEFGEDRHPNPKIIIWSKDFKNRSNNYPEGERPAGHGNAGMEKLDESEEQQDVVNYNIHAFYYAWYGSPAQDGQYLHWNHKYLPHWDKRVSAKYPTGQAHVPPDDIGSSYYPLLGAYSSLDEVITRAHMMQLQKAGIGVLALSWYPPGMADDQGQPIDSYIPTIFDIADQYQIKVCFHIEPYKGRTSGSVKENLIYIVEKYGEHPAFYRHQRPSGGDLLPLVYIYDSYLLPSEEWKTLLTPGDMSIRGTKYDSIVIGLLVEKKHMSSLASSGFDGIYTYFAADGFSYGSSQRYWHQIAHMAKLNNMMFIPSVGPGYDDLKVRPWNGENVRSRDKGKYYETGWKTATSCDSVSIISITSFNEWHEGTQIEAASPNTQVGEFSYLTYSPHNPEHYLDVTKKWSQELLKRSHKK